MDDANCRSKKMLDSGYRVPFVLEEDRREEPKTQMYECIVLRVRGTPPTCHWAFTYRGNYTKILSIRSSLKEDFKAEESFVCRKANAALKIYTQRTRGPEYELHVICGLNSNVVNPGIRALHYGARLSKHRCKSQYSHINFFGESNSDKEDTIDEPSCWLVAGHPGHCFHCEDEGAKIIHPDLKKYNGRDIDFEEMACDSHSNCITTEDIIKSRRAHTDSCGHIRGGLYLF
uniref:PH01B001G05.8 protein n=1 Tax=Phyllostachys edulis TaxID=38705 RepID=L0P1Y1_PHYED|nr:PH01B001G05.8 [Phyllostachys edulis]